MITYKQTYLGHSPHSHRSGIFATTERVHSNPQSQTCRLTVLCPGTLTRSHALEHNVDHYNLQQPFSASVTYVFFLLLWWLYANFCLVNSPLTSVRQPNKKRTHIHIQRPNYVYVCVYVFVYACMHACMHACMYVCICMYACMHACMYVNICKYVKMYICQYVYMYICTYIHMYICIYK